MIFLAKVIGPKNAGRCRLQIIPGDISSWRDIAVENNYRRLF
ncbi:hypothetical protein ENTCAN_06070 [Enterobacter cancerogenus ATCC 35316]|nr:hypothetical protein ENTCAN_06070 [Enterobacter cancerogenus ATCC 35316]